jgi:hypothetical protein
MKKHSHTNVDGMFKRKNIDEAKERGACKIREIDDKHP